MMKQVRTKKVDGYDVVVGFTDASIDPEGTKIQVREKVSQSPEAKQYQDIVDEIGDIQDAIKGKMIELRNEEASESVSKIINAEIKALKAEIEKRQVSMQELSKKIAQMIKDLREDNLVYFNHTDNLSEDEYSDLSGKLHKEADKALLRDGSTITDLRGKPYAEDGVIHVVTKLGVEKNVIPIGSTEDEIEEIRMASHSKESKEAEYTRLVDDAASKAAFERLKQEAKIDPSLPDADREIAENNTKKESQEAYRATLARLKKKYE